MSTHPPDHDGCQTFRFMAFQWCVTRAQELIAADPQAAGFWPRLDITALETFLPLRPDPPDTIRLIRIDVDTDYAMRTDLSKPLIISPLLRGDDDFGAVVIDGWHRAYRALREGRTDLPAHMLTPATESAARIPLVDWFPPGTTITEVDSSPPDPAD